MDAGDGTTVALILKEGFAWLRGRRQKGEETDQVDVGPQPLDVKLREEFVRHWEFDAYRADNEKAHAGLFERMRRRRRRRRSGAGRCG